MSPGPDGRLTIPANTGFTGSATSAGISIARRLIVNPLANLLQDELEMIATVVEQLRADLLDSDRRARIVAADALVQAWAAPQQAQTALFERLGGDPIDISSERAWNQIGERAMTVFFDALQDEASGSSERSLFAVNDLIDDANAGSFDHAGRIRNAGFR